MPGQSHRRTRPVTPVMINRNTKEYIGFSVLVDSDDKVTLAAHWIEPLPDGTLHKYTKGVDPVPIQAMTGYDAIHDAIVAASE